MNDAEKQAWNDEIAKLAREAVQREATVQSASIAGAFGARIQELQVQIQAQVMMGIEKEYFLVKKGWKSTLVFGFSVLAALGSIGSGILFYLGALRTDAATAAREALIERVKEPATQQALAQVAEAAVLAGRVREQFGAGSIPERVASLESDVDFHTVQLNRTGSVLAYVTSHYHDGMVSEEYSKLNRGLALDAASAGLSAVGHIPVDRRKAAEEKFKPPRSLIDNPPK